MTQRTRLPDVACGNCDVCDGEGLCRRIRIEVGGVHLRDICAPCLSVLNGPLKAPVFTGIDNYRFQKRNGTVYYTTCPDGWTRVWPETRDRTGFSAGDRIWHPIDLRAIADALESV